MPLFPVNSRPLARSVVRLIASVVMPMILAACVTSPGSVPSVSTAIPPQPSIEEKRYAAIENEPFHVPSVSLDQLKPRNMRMLVDDPTGQPPGTIVVDPHNRFLYLVQQDGKALRYGVGVGRAGLEFTGTANVGGKREWPRWTPTPNMISREPEKYAKWAKGMDGGSQNPLGARALYLFKDGKDTLYRIHGTNEPDTIGEAVSSGCIRMMNQDVIDLYRRVSNGAKVVVL